MAYGLATLIALVVVFNVLSGVALRAERGAQTDRARGVATTLALSVDPSLVADRATDASALRPQLAQLISREPDLDAVWILRSTDIPHAMEVVAEYRADGLQRSPRTPVDASGVPALVAVVSDAPVAAAHTSLLGVAPVRSSSGQVLGVVGVTVRPGVIEAFSERMVGLFLGSVAFVGAAFSLLTAILGRWFGGQWHRVPVVPMPDDELGALARRFDRLARMVEERRLVGRGGLIDATDLDDVLPPSPSERGRELQVAAVAVDFAVTDQLAVAPEVVALMNEVLHDVATITDVHSGTLARGPGAATLLFGGPVPLDAAEQAAVRAAVDLRHRIDRRQREWAKAGRGWPVDVHVVAHAGVAVLGAVGTPARREPRIAGEVANVLDGLLTLARSRDGGLLVTADIIDVVVSPVGTVDTGRSISVDGRAPVRVFAVANVRPSLSVVGGRA